MSCYFEQSEMLLFSSLLTSLVSSLMLLDNKNCFGKFRKKLSVFTIKSAHKYIGNMKSQLWN